MPVYSLCYSSLVSQLLAQCRDDRVDYITAKVVLEAPDIVQKFYSRYRLSVAAENSLPTKTESVTEAKSDRA